MTSQKITELRNEVDTVYQGLSHLESLLYSIKMMARDASQQTDPTAALGHMETMCDMGSERAGFHAEIVSNLESIIDGLDKPVVDMTNSALQVSSIQQLLAALVQTIPEDQADVIGSIKTAIRLAHDLSTHLITGGQYRLVLKESPEEPKEASHE